MASHDRPPSVATSDYVGVTAGYGYAITALVATAVFLLAYENGTYALADRLAVAVAVWWGVAVALVVGVRAARCSVAALATSGLLAAFAAWTLASVIWASDAEAAYTEFARVALYVGLLILVVLLARRDSTDFWTDGLALGILAIAALALASRMYPDTIGSSAGVADLPVLRSRLSYPIGYWNGLGIFAALGIPLVLGAALRARAHVLVRALFLAGTPVLAAMIYLTSSRGAFATAFTGVLVFLALCPRRWSALGATLLGGAASAAAIETFSSRTALANGLARAATTGEGGSASAWLAAICALTVIVYVAGLAAPRPTWNASRNLGWGVAGGVTLAFMLVAVAAHPLRHFDEFKRPPVPLAASQRNFVNAHLFSASGSGRWQFWQAAVAEYDKHPLLGGGAGSYAEWWAEHGTLATSIQDAHSLYLQTLGELGIVGLTLLVLFVLAGLTVVARAVRAGDRDESWSAAAVGATFCAFLLAAAIDWMWELTAVAALAFICLGLAVALAGGSSHLPTARRSRIAWRTGAVAAALALLAAEGWPLLAQVRIGESQNASLHGSLPQALADARAAVGVQPWASTPYLQLALVYEQRGALAAAHSAIGQALARDPGGWQLALVSARIETEQGDIAAARKEYARARALNPRSPLFAATAS